MSFFDSIQELLRQELYDEIVFLDELVPENFRGNPTAKNEALTLAYIGEAYFQLENYSFSVKNFKSALEGYTRCPRAISTKGYTEVDIRFRYHRALVKLRKFDEAINILREIPNKDAPLKVLAAIGKLIAARDGPTESLPSSFHESIVRGCPSALMSMARCFKDGQDVEAIPEFLKSIPHVKTFMQSQKLLGQGGQRNAIDCLLALAEPSYKILTEAGYQMYLSGMDDAKHILHKAHRKEPEKTTHMDVLSFLYYSEEVYHPELEPLAVRLMKESPESAEAQISFTYFTRSHETQNRAKALQMAFAACNINPFSNNATTQALLLKATILLEMEQSDDAIATIQEGLKRDPHNYDLQRAMVNSLMSKRQVGESRNWLNSIAIVHHNEPRVDMLQAEVLLKIGCHDATKEAEIMLEKTVEADAHQMGAIWVLLGYYEESGQFIKGRDLLRKLSRGPYNAPNMARIHRKLADFLLKCSETGDAYESASMAVVNNRQDASVQVSSLEASMVATPAPNAPGPLTGPPQPLRRSRRRAGASSTGPNANNS